MATTTNFGWETPDDTDLVKDGAAAMRTLGNAIDASLVDLKGGTTGQVLSKASNTDLDYSWVTPELGDITAVTVSSPITGGGTTGSVNIAIQDGTTAQKGAVQLEDSTSSTSTTKAATPNSVKTAYDLANGAIAKSIVDAKADLITATADNTPARLAVGNDGETLVADSSATTGLRWQGNFAAGKNKIINGDFNIWQRGTSFTTNGYTCDRFNTSASGGTNTFSRQAFTAGAAPVAGYESQYFLRIATSATATYFDIAQPIEDVRTFAGQTITFSFWAKASSSVGVIALARQFFGTGGSANVDHSSSTITLTTSWTRYSFTTTLGSLSGKTIGTNNALNIFLYYTSGTVTSNNIDTWGWQVEAGNTATAFQTATGTLAGELVACKFYCQNINYSLSGKNVYNTISNGSATGATSARVTLNLPSPMRVAPTSVTFTANGFVLDNVASAPTVTGVTINQGGTDTVLLTVDASAGALTNKDPVIMYANNNSSANLILSAEL